jgi:uncharacterized protein YbjT (DUF2867 family)
LGSNIVKYLVKSGAKVAVLGRNKKKADKFAKSFSNTQVLGFK